MERRESNYEIMKRQMQVQFASYDMEKMAGEWDLLCLKDCLITEFVGRTYQIHCSSGVITYEEDGVTKEADYNVSMTLFDILSRERHYSAGTFRTSGSFSKVQLATPSRFSGGFFQNSAKFFDQQEQKLIAACEKLGGVPYGKGDVGYRIPLFKDLDLILQFYSSDDEFDAELNLFCDENILQYMHFETMMFMLGHVMERLRTLMEA